MIPESWKSWTLLMLLFVIQPVKSDPCNITDMDKINGYCLARIDCQEELDFDVETWSCIKHTRREQYYDYTYGTRYRNINNYDENYYLMVYIKEPVEIDSLLLHEKHFITLIMEDGELVNVPEDVFKMDILSELDLSGNKIGTVNFNKFLLVDKLKSIILKNNMIRIIETDSKNDASLQSKISSIEIIDMSNNFLQVLPNNFLSRFVQLQHLNLSHNMITSIGLLTFEGIVQLQTLDLSYNRLSEIGHALARFSNMKEISISHNNISYIFGYNFATMTNLEKLNASFNSITTIENITLQALSKLRDLDLRHNNLIIISEQFFVSNINLNSLLLSNNRIQYIDENSFINTHLVTFSIDNNVLNGSLKKNTFKGVNASELNLSGGNLSSIEDEAFNGMFQLSSLNLSSNLISKLSFSAFFSTISLNILDLSHNKLEELDFDSNSLKNLTILYAHHNNIETIKKSLFENLLSLKELDLSFNDLRQIESGAILKLSNVIFFSVKNSNFVNILDSKTLEGLISLKKIDMSVTKTTVFKNESFSGLISLTNVNYTFGQLAEIEYNAFLGLGILEKLFLSNNQLQQFHINTSSISHIQEIYLNNNYIKNISSQTFYYLTSLRILNLANNDIIKLNSDVFLHLSALTHLDLSSNEKMKIVGNPFQTLSRLYSLSLENVKWNISFANSSASIEILNLNYCGLSDINKISVFNVQDLTYLYLSINEITTINKHSFGNITTLVSLDLSLNKIVFIQPGSFLYLKSLRNLNLHGNFLSSIQFGVFDGIEALKDLNLSSNLFSRFDAKLLPNTERLFLDNNIIVDIHLEDFLNSDLSKLSIGGNQISCMVLAKLKSLDYYSEKFSNIVTAKILDYHSENVDGITCQTVTNIMPATYDNQTNNSPIFNPLIATFRNILDKLSQSMQIMSENNKIGDELKNEGKNVAKLLEDIISIKNNTHIASNRYIKEYKEIKNDSNIQIYKYLSNIADINNVSNGQIAEIKTYLKQLFNNKKEFEFDSRSNMKSPVDEQSLRLEFKKMLEQENDAIRQEVKNALENIAKGHPIQESLFVHERNTDNSKTVLYFIAACLSIMLSVYIGNIVFKQIIAFRRSHNYRTRNSTANITNSIEME